MSIEVVKEYSIYDYVGTFGKFSKCAEEFLDSLNEDISFKRINEDDGVIIINTKKDKHKIAFTVNNVSFDYRDGNLYFNHYFDVLRDTPCILDLLIVAFNEMLLCRDIEIDKISTLEMVGAFISLKMWFSDSRIEVLEDRLEREESEQRARENAEFWAEYFFFNPNDV